MLQLLAQVLCCLGSYVFLKRAVGFRFEFDLLPRRRLWVQKPCLRSSSSWALPVVDDPVLFRVAERLDSHRSLTELLSVGCPFTALHCVGLQSTSQSGESKQHPSSLTVFRGGGRTRTSTKLLVVTVIRTYIGPPRPPASASQRGGESKKELVPPAVVHCADCSFPTARCCGHLDSYCGPPSLLGCRSLCSWRHPPSRPSSILKFLGVWPCRAIPCQPLPKKVHSGDDRRLRRQSYMAIRGARGKRHTPC